MAAMNGLEKITGQILSEARGEAKEIEKRAEEEAKTVSVRVQDEVRELEAKAKDSLERELAEIRSREKARREQTRNRAILEAKQKIIEEMITKAKRRIQDADSAEYFEKMKEIFSKYAHEESGVMYFGTRDFERMPAKFVQEIQKTAREKGGDIILKEDASVPDGFLLVYGRIEENCTLDALFSEKKEILQDTVNGMLWRESNGR